MHPMLSFLLAGFLAITLSACGNKAAPADSPWLAGPGVSVQEMEERAAKRAQQDQVAVDAARAELVRRQGNYPSAVLPANTGTIVPPWMLGLPAEPNLRGATVVPTWQQPSAAAGARAAADAARAAARR